MKRREFLFTVAAGSAATLAGTATAAETPRAISAGYIPPLKGFNLLEKFTLRQNAPYKEQDFEWMAGWGFNFVRLPLDYRCWTNPEKPDQLDEKILKEIDQAVEFGKRYKVHVNINLHRAPGYCVNPPKEKLDLWKEEEAVKQFCRQWKTFAERYKGIPNERVSFDLINEPSSTIATPDYVRVMSATIDTIRNVDPERLIVVDGLSWGTKPVFDLVEKKVAQSTRGYNPMQISHCKASWIEGSDKWPVPEWPLKIGDRIFDKERCRREYIEPWKALQQKGAGVHVGEWGAFNKTPHSVVLAWMEDMLSLWKEAGWGCAMWNFRGSFGILDSGRDDVQYEDFKGHKLDRKMLELNKKFL